LRSTNEMVLLRLAQYGICQIECITSHADVADAGLSLLYGGQLRCIGFVASSGELNFTCMVLKLSLGSRKGVLYICAVETHMSLSAHIPISVHPSSFALLSTATRTQPARELSNVQLGTPDRVP